MKKLLSFLVMALLFVACQNDLGYDTTENGLVTARFGVSAGELSTRADDAIATTGYSSALGAIGNFTEADWAKYNLRFTFEVYKKDDNGSGTPIAKERQVIIVDSYEEGDVIFFEARLVPNKEYKFVVFADFVDNNATVENVEDLFYDTTDLRNITMIDKKMNPMNEARDAYFVSKNLLVKTSIEESLRLSRPFGKIRVVTNDIEYINKYSTPAKAEITYKNLPLYKSFNAVNGKVSTERTGDNELKFEYELGKDKLYTEGRDAEASDMTLFADYLLALPEGQCEVNFLLNVYDDQGELIKSNDFIGQIPIERNHLTTIEGSLLTLNANIKVVVDSEFADKEYVIDNIWDGTYKELPKANDEGVVEIAEAGELATLLSEGSDKAIKVEITKDFNFDGYVIEPVADKNKFKNVEINGNNNTISNLVIKGAETRANGGVAALFPVVVGAKIENLTISNVTVDAGEGDHAYAAALIGKSYGTVTLNNVFVKNSTIKGTNKVGGLVASVMENNIIATNCGVDKVTIKTYDVENESGLAGGLIGYIACAGDGKLQESCIEDCFVTNSTFNVINSRGNHERSNSEFIGGIGGDKGDVLLINNATIEGNEFNETGAEEYTSPYGSLIGGIRGNFKVYINDEMVGKLEKPVVTATIEGNIITLTWDAIDGAETYSITNGTEMPVFVEETTYVFTGEYETEYTFNVVALSKNEEITPSDAAVVTVTTEAEPTVEPKYTTVAEFLAADVDDTTFYTLKGTITRVVNTSYGNFDLTDETGTIYVYGLYSEDGATEKYWAKSGAKIGDDIVISAKRAEYKGSAQAGSARFMGLTSPGTLAFWSFSKTATTFTSAGGEQVISVEAYNLTASITVASDNEQFSAKYADGALTITAHENTTTEAINGSITVTSGTLEQVITITQGGVSLDGGNEVVAEATMESFGWANAAVVKEAIIDDNVKVKFAQGKASTAPAYYTSGKAVRLYQNGATMTVTANGKTIKSMEITFSQNHYYMKPDCGEFSAEGEVRTWTGEATEVKFTTTGTDKNHRAYIAKIKVTYVE